MLKAELLRLGWLLVRTHDLLNLAGELRARGSDLVDAIEPLCTSLGQDYFVQRYPGFDLEDPDWPEVRRLAAAAGRLLDTIANRLPGPQALS